MALHDHFGGSAHCVECAGPCQLKGGDLLLTQLARAFMVLRVRKQGRCSLGMMERDVIERAGADPDKLCRRAEETSR